MLAPNQVPIIHHGCSDEQNLTLVCVGAVSSLSVMCWNGCFKLIRRRRSIGCSHGRAHNRIPFQPRGRVGRTPAWRGGMPSSIQGIDLLLCDGQREEILCRIPRRPASALLTRTFSPLLLVIVKGGPEDRQRSWGRISCYHHCHHWKTDK